MAITFIKKPQTALKPEAAPSLGTFSPNLAADFSESEWDFKTQGSLIALPKLNGVRGGIQSSVLLARSLKPIRNKHTSRLFSHECLNGLEGELVVGAFHDENVFVNTTSGVGSGDGMPDVILHAFDVFHPTLPFIARLQVRQELVQASLVPFIEVVPFRIMKSVGDVKEYGLESLTLGYEGLVLRAPNLRYKQGRSTAKEGGFMRYVPWLTSEALILDILEGEVNNNPSVVNELGFKKKSSHQENKVGSGRAGVFVVRDIHTGIEFRMPVPTVKLQDEVWNNKAKYIGKIMRYKFKPAVKTGGKPRFSQFEGWRESWDMS